VQTSINVLQIMNCRQNC